MNVLAGTEARIVALLEKGARIVYHYYWHGYDQYSTVVKITLEHNGYELVLNDPVEYPEFAEDPISATSPIAETIIARSDVRETYAGYHSEYARQWRRAYEHRATPVPRWVKEQSYE